MVAHLLPKQVVASSNLVSRSIKRRPDAVWHQGAFGFSIVCSQRCSQSLNLSVFLSVLLE